MSRQGAWEYFAKRAQGRLAESAAANDDLSEDEAMQLAVVEVRAVRRERRADRATSISAQSVACSTASTSVRSKVRQRRPSVARSRPGKWARIPPWSPHEDPRVARANSFGHSFTPTPTLVTRGPPTKRQPARPAVDQFRQLSARGTPKASGLRPVRTSRSALRGSALHRMSRQRFGRRAGLRDRRGYRWGNRGPHPLGSQDPPRPSHHLRQA